MVNRCQRTCGRRTDQDRRNFITRALSFLGVSVCGSAISSILSGCESDVLKSSNVAVQVDLNEIPELAQVGGAVKRTFTSHNGGRPVMILRVEDQEFLVLSTVCTHQACEVNLPGARGYSEISCDCHGSLYDPSTGSVVRGPALAPLPRFQGDFDDSNDILTITF